MRFGTTLVAVPAKGSIAFRSFEVGSFYLFFVEVKTIDTKGNLRFRVFHDFILSEDRLF